MKRYKKLFQEMAHNLEVIDKFLLEWKTRATDIYLHLLEEYNLLLQQQKEYVNKFNNVAVRLSLPKEEQEKFKQEMDNFHRKKFYPFRDSNKLLMSLTQRYGSSSEKILPHLEKILDDEVNKKRQKLLLQIESKAGEIVDASFLRLSGKGELNGFVTGTKATVEVETIFAGGYNIQILHYRTLVKVIKK